MCEWPYTNYPAKVIRLDNFGLTPVRCATFKSWGLLAALSIMRLNILPPGISPLWFIACLHDAHSILDLDWMSTVLPGLASQICILPSEPTSDSAFYDPDHPDAKGLMLFIDTLTGHSVSTRYFCILPYTHLA